MEGRWAVAVTELYKQEKVIEQLVARGFQYFWPRVRKTVRRRGRRVHRLDPLLYNYLPVHLAAGWQNIFDMRGVVDLMGPASTRQIESLMARCDKDHILIKDEVKPEFEIGQPVRPSKGPLVWMTGNYGGLTDEDHELVVFEFLGAKRSIRFETGSLVAA